MITKQNSAIITVDEMTVIIKKTICSAIELQNISIKGEVSGFKRHTSGHLYFTILGKESRISAVMFKSAASLSLSWMKDGDEVCVNGRIDVYGARGAYQFYANLITPLGAGAKARAKEMLRDRLEREGLFSLSIKRKTPPFPKKVAVITSPTGAALQDVLKISQKRYPLADILIVPSLMQGDLALPEIIYAFEKLNFINDVDIIMLVRGGGAKEDLDVFDNEEIVRAIRRTHVPVITGLGHQIDSTLSDMAADVFAPTPSGAAEMIFPDSVEIKRYLKQIKHYSENRLISLIKKQKDKLNLNINKLNYNILKSMIYPNMNTLKNAYDRINKAVLYKLNFFENKLSYNAVTLDSISPLMKLQKGFLIAENNQHVRIRSINDVAIGDEIKIFTKDGNIDAIIKKIRVKKAV
ncbi:MAG: exodeoxyribonuclease VII large subunit [Synergistaceae bacterium]